MIGLLARKPDIILAVLAVYFIVNILVRITLPHSLELDEAEQVFLSQFVAAGYGSQPPLYNWLYYGLAQLTGPSVASLAILKSCLLFASYVLYYRASRLLIENPLLAVVSTLGLLTIPQIAFEAQRDLTHTVGVIFASCLFVYGLARTLKKPDLLSYAITGLAIGIGLIAKYNFALLAGGTFIALLATPTGRQRLFDIRLIVTALLAAAIVAPHAIWLLGHVNEASSQTLGKMGVGAALTKPEQIGHGLSSLLLAIVGFSALTIIAFAASFRRKLLRSLSMRNTAILTIQVLWASVALALVAMILLTDTTMIKDRWLTPVLIMLPLYLGLKLDALNIDMDRPARTILVVAAVIMVIVPLALNLRVTLGGALGRYEKLNVPYGPFAEEIVRKVPIQPAAILAADKHLAGNMALHWRHGPVMAANYPAFAPMVKYDATHPLLIIWRARGQANPPMPDIINAWLKSNPDFAGVHVNPLFIALPYHHGRDDYGFGYAVVAPLR